MDKRGHWVFKAKRWQPAQDHQSQAGPHCCTAENQRGFGHAIAKKLQRYGKGTTSFGPAIAKELPANEIIMQLTALAPSMLCSSRFQAGPPHFLLSLPFQAKPISYMPMKAVLYFIGKYQLCLSSSGLLCWLNRKIQSWQKQCMNSILTRMMMMSLTSLLIFA